MVTGSRHRNVQTSYPGFSVIQGREPMDNKTNVQTCVWAEPTLYQDGPYWLDAWNMPWTCRRDGDPRVLDDTDVCVGCPRWEPRVVKAVAWPFDKEPVKS